ncbi:hypothetical protein HPP92_002521 [Vanilla planifolia]|uniref:APO domain-containing protein n=1 Tax=Vanilla planifolia TaxID=51239 RepID=A0A835VI38_VANPL|nr:hypothetical protein HPP92_002521 [Vanilla planifolia]
MRANPKRLISTTPSEVQNEKDYESAIINISCTFPLRSLRLSSAPENMLAASSLANPRLLPVSSSFLLSSSSSSSSSSFSSVINLFPPPPRSYIRFSQSGVARLRVKCTAFRPPKSPAEQDWKIKREFLLQKGRGGNSSGFLLTVKSPVITIRSSQRRYDTTIRNSYPQNADPPRFYSRKEKKPYPVPIIELRRAARQRLKKLREMPRRPIPPPRNGMLVKSLVAVAYEVLNARTALINNLKRLMKVAPVNACKHCNEIHVGATGHPFPSCRGIRAERRRGLHEWTAAVVDDVFVPVEAFHLFDRLGRRISHEERFAVPRVPALVELCVQAGVDLPDLPTKRRRKPVIRRGRAR